MIKQIICGFIVSSLIITCSISCKKEQQERTVPVPEIAVSKPIVKDIMLTKMYPGYLSSEQTVNLVARVDGYLQKVLYHPGATVNKDQLLFVIEPAKYQDLVEQAKASLVTAEAQLSYARNNYSRMKEAAASNAVSEIDLIQSKTAVDKAIAALSSAKASLSSAKTTLDYCYIKAPSEGRVSRNLFDVGNYISGSVQPTTLATLYNDNKMYAYFNIEGNQFMSMAKDSKKDSTNNHVLHQIEIQINENQMKPYHGELDYYSPNIDLGTGTLSLRAEVDNPNRELKSGAYVRITLPYAEKKNAVLVLDASIGTDQLGKYVYLVNDSNIVKYQPITIGQLVEDTLREIISGVKANELYVTKALLKVQNDMKIAPQKALK